MARTKGRTKTLSSVKRKSVSWEDFRKKTLGRTGWQVQAGTSVYAASRGGSGITQVRISLPSNILDGSDKRAEIADPSSRMPVEFEVVALSKDGSEMNDATTLAAFSTEWTRLWRAGCCGRTAYVPPYRIIPKPPERMMGLMSLKFSEDELRHYRTLPMSKSSCGTLFGQLAHMVADRTGTPRTGYEGVVSEMEPKALSETKECVFCSATGTIPYVLAELEAEYLGVSGDLVLHACSGCGRIVGSGEE